MVQFTQTDFQILLVMSLFLVIVSFLFPAMGFTSQDINASDIPEFNASQNQFSFVDEAPEPPGNPNAGTLHWVNNSQSYEDTDTIWIANDYAVSTYNAGTESNPNVRVNLLDFTPSTGTNITHDFISPGEFVVLENWSYAVSFENLQFNDSTNNSYTVDFTVKRRPDTSSGGWIDAIPVIGGLISAGSELAQSALWIGQILFHVVLLAFETVGNSFIALFNLLVFVFSFMYWLLSTYGAVVSASPNAWVGVFVAIPGIIISFEFGKLTILLIRTILEGVPFT